MQNNVIVVKIGSSSLTSDEGGLNRNKIAYFAEELAALHRQNVQVILVTSGAVAAGFKQIGYKSRPKLLHEKQAAAAVGQALLMQAYQEQFIKHRINTAQILLTRSDFSNPKQIHNALMTIHELMRRRVVPIINENDSIAVDELKFGDNDTLSALVANLVKAEKLVILTDTDGLYTSDPRKDPNARHIKRVKEINEDIFRIAGGSGSAVGTGGMRSKIEAARIAVRGGVPVFIGKAEQQDDLLKAWQDQGRGTYFDTTLHNLSTKKLWVGFHSEPKGRITIDEGAEHALLMDGRSLLPAGITQVNGDFHPGDVIEVENIHQVVIGRGVCNYSAWQLQAAKGLSSEEVKHRIEVQRIEVIHRDEWVSFARS